MNKIKVMIIDEQAFFRTGVRQTLSKESDMEILECDLTQDALEMIETHLTQDALEMIETHLPDIALLGSDLASRSGLELGRKIAQHYPNTKVIMLSPDPDDMELFEVIKTAAVACLNKKSSSEELVNTIRRARNGEYPINESVMTSPQVARHVLNQFRGLGKTMGSVVAPLTNRETQILNYIAEGNSNKVIAHILGISEQTIKNHVSAILRKLNANDRAQPTLLP